MMMILTILVIPLVIAGQSGMNYYSTSNRNISIVPNQTYKFKFMMDDIGTMTSTPAIADIDGDGINELLIPEYSGKMRVWNWSGMIRGQRESIDGTDRGTYYITTADGWKTIGEDNNGNGCLEIAANDYTGKILVLEYCAGSWSTLLSTSDLGDFRSSPTWCDVDDDGDLDVFSCSYTGGACRLYTYAQTGSYDLNFTDSDRGSYHYGDAPTCGNWSNSHYGYGLVSGTYEGVLYFWDWNTTTNTLELIDQAADHGSFYASPYIGNIAEGTTENQVIGFYTSGVAYAFNCTLDGCVEIDSSSDVGTFVYGTSTYHEREVDGQTYLIMMNSGARPILVYMDDISTLTAEYISDLALYDSSYTPIGVPKVNATNNYNYLLYQNRNYADIAVSKGNTGYGWNVNYYRKNIIEDFFTREYYTGFLYGSGWACGQLDHSTDSDECVIITYQGIPLVYTLQNITEFDIDYYDDYELSLLDIMPRDATMYLARGDTTTSCVNEKDNVLKYGIGGGNITPWISAMDDEGDPIANAERITNGILSTATHFHNQNSADYTTWDSGTEQSMRMNLTKVPQLGMIQFWGRFGSEIDPLDLRVEISETICTDPDTNTYITIFNETADNTTDITGASTYQGQKIYFTPQDVGCIRVTASGSWYDSVSYITSNGVTEIAGYYGNDCTFYHVPVDDLKADVSQSYNSSIGIEKGLNKESPNQFDNDRIGKMSEWISNILDVINRIILRRA